MLEDGCVVSPGGGGQVDDFVAGEPLGQEVSTDPKDCSKRDQNKCIFVITFARFILRSPTTAFGLWRSGCQLEYCVKIGKYTIKDSVDWFCQYDRPHIFHNEGLICLEGVLVIFKPILPSLIRCAYSLSPPCRN